jgi:hypothetical protein
MKNDNMIEEVLFRRRIQIEMMHATSKEAIKAVFNEALRHAKAVADIASEELDRLGRAIDKAKTDIEAEKARWG